MQKLKFLFKKKGFMRKSSPWNHFLHSPHKYSQRKGTDIGTQCVVYLGILQQHFIEKIL